MIAWTYLSFCQIKNRLLSLFRKSTPMKTKVTMDIHGAWPYLPLFWNFYKQALKCVTKSQAYAVCIGQVLRIAKIYWTKETIEHNQLLIGKLEHKGYNPYILQRTPSKCLKRYGAILLQKYNTAEKYILHVLSIKTIWQTSHMKEGR